MGLLATILGIAQDGGIPQASLSLDNWKVYQSGVVYHPVSLGVLSDDGNGHLFDVTRCLPWQLALWQQKCSGQINKISDVWISHSHLSHVDGLRQFGTASMGLKGINLRCSKLFAGEIESNQWIQELIDDGTFQLKIWDEGEEIVVTNGFKVMPISVPHRTKGSDTHCFLVTGTMKKLLYLSDHDSWDETLINMGFSNPMDWFKSLGTDIVLVDGTFWSHDELLGRNQTEVPHPTVQETLELIGDKKFDDPEIIFIHLNHTNPLLNKLGAEYKRLTKKGWSVGHEGQTFELN
mgnify:CR=1 FL=1